MHAIIRWMILMGESKLVWFSNYVQDFMANLTPDAGLS